MEKQLLNKKAYSKYLLSLLLFGSNGILASFIPLASNNIVFLRTTIGSLLLLLIFIGLKQKFTFPQFKKDTIHIILSGISMATCWLFLYEAYQQIGVSMATLLYYTGPIFVMILSPIVFKEKLTTQKLVSISIVILGVYLLNRHTTNPQYTIIGAFYGIFAAILYAGMVIFNKKAESVDGLEKSLIQLLTSFVVITLYMIVTRGFNIPFRGMNWLPVLALGMTTGIGCYLYFSPLKALPVQTVAISGYLEPLSAVLLSVILLGESLSSLQLLGAFCIIGGAILGEMKFKKTVLEKSNRYERG